MEIVRFAVGALLLVASALLAVQLWNGRWQFLVARPERTKKGTFFPAGTRETGRRLSWVMVACFAAVATLMASEMGRLSGSALFAQAGFVVSGVALVAYGPSSYGPWPSTARRTAAPTSPAALRA